MKKRLPLLLLVILFAVLLLSYPAESAAAAREGVTLCLELIVPSLFPFFVLSSLFVSLGFAELLGALVHRWMWPLFRLSGRSATPIILGLIGGYPVGIRSAAALYESKQCSKEEFLHLTCFCNNCGPAFLLSVAGIGIFVSKEAGFLLLGTHWAASIIIGLLARHVLGSRSANARQTDRNSPSAAVPFSTAFPNCVRDSFSSTLNVCAFVILFSVFIRLAQCSGALPWLAQALSSLLPVACSFDLCRSILIGIFELSTGVYALAEVYTAPLALPLAAFILGWGGLSVHCQSLPYLNSCPSALLPYFCSKLLQGLLAAAFVAIFAPLLPLEAGSAAVQAGLWTLPAMSLLRQEMLALWFLSGIFYFFWGKKTGKYLCPDV